MANEKISWGEERVANELLLKLGISVLPRTVRKYMPKRSNNPGPPGGQRWSTIPKNHASAIVACDFCIVVTANFRMLYAIVLIEHRSRRLFHINSTANPTADWRVNKFAKPFHQINNIDTYSMTAIVYSQPTLTKPLRTLESNRLEHHDRVQKLTLSVSV